MSGKPIGELNGRWALLLKVTLVTIPVLTTLVTASFLPWAVWVTTNVYTAQQTSNIVAKVADDLDVMDTRIDNLPPAEWRQRITKLEDASLENRDDHTQIKVALAEIKSDVKTIATKGVNQ